MNSVDEDFLKELLKSIGIMLSVVPTFCGVALGIREAVIGICKSAELTLELSLTILPFAFLTAPVIYSCIIFFVLYNKKIETLASGLNLLTATFISGMGGFFASYAVGGIAKNACVTRSRQKKFTPQLFLMMIFAELIGVFGVIVALIYNK